jgi:soluble lytic murein transglycosylase-like protein
MNASVSGLESTSAAGARGGEPLAGTAAAERVQQLQTLLAQIEHRPADGASKTFASALAAAQSGQENPEATASAYTSPQPTAPTAYAPLTPAAGAGIASETPTALAYDSTAPAGASAVGVSTTGASVAGLSSAYAPLIEQAAARNGLDPAILSGLIQQESGFDPTATSSAGALGLTQLMPSTAASLGVAEPLNPAQSIEGGARYLSGLLHQFAGNTADALAAYNAGPGAVEQYGGVPPYPETQQYVTNVLGYAAAYSQSGQGASAMAQPSAAAPTAAAPSEAIV